MVKRYKQNAVTLKTLGQWNLLLKLSVVLNNFESICLGLLLSCKT